MRNDQGQFHPMIDRSEENIESNIELVYIDGGYRNDKGLTKFEERNIEGFVVTRKAKNSALKKKTSDKKIKSNTSSQGCICHKTTKNVKTYKYPDFFTCSISQLNLLS